MNRLAKTDRWPPLHRDGSAGAWVCRFTHLSPADSDLPTHDVRMPDVRSRLNVSKARPVQSAAIKDGQARARASNQEGHAPVDADPHGQGG